MIAVINYGAGNLPNAVRALEHVGATLHITEQAADLQQARAIVLPGVGATADTMRSLDAMGMSDAIRAAVAAGTPFLGICVGMQVLAEASEEFGLHPCLGIIPGVVRRLPATNKVPQIGWNQVEHTGGPLWDGIPSGAEFYFVHSFFVDTPGSIVGRTDYGGMFPAALSRDNLTAVQFHPEKSGAWGLKLLANWVQMSASSARK